MLTILVKVTPNSNIFYFLKISIYIFYFYYIFEVSSVTSAGLEFMTLRSKVAYPAD